MRSGFLTTTALAAVTVAALAAAPAARAIPTIKAQLAANMAPAVASTSQVSQGYVRRNAKAYIPDGWLQVLYKKFRFEAEGRARTDGARWTRPGAGS